MSSQSVVKHFLTEGDKLLVSYWSPLEDQGGYAIAVNYGMSRSDCNMIFVRIFVLGSLIARIVFQPIEEICRVYFSKVLSSTTPEKDSTANTTPGNSGALDQASAAVASLLSVQLAFSMLVVTFGSSYLPIVLQLLLPAQYISTSAPNVLSAWIYYIPVLALNGGLEAVYSSVATSQDLRAQSRSVIFPLCRLVLTLCRWMLTFSVIYILSAAALYNLGFGDTSLVYANIANLTARIWYTSTFITEYFGKRMESHSFRLKNMVPSWTFSSMVVLSFFVISRNEARQHIKEEARHLGHKVLFSTSVLAHVALGGGLGLVCVGLWWVTEGRRLITRERIKAE